ncbi:MAG TPA: hypothetical protein VNW72_04655 [Chthoniobacterales bacterium]|nr:hypothetical protein [Chthoniobacterales bacterium]
MQNFTGVDTIFVVNSRLMERALFAVISLVGFGLMQQTARADFDPIFGFYRPELFSTIDSADLVRDLSMREFLDGRVPGSTAMGRMGTAPVGNFPMALVNAEPRKKGNSISGPVKDPKDGKDYASVESLATEKASLAWTGGEVGFIFGHSSGKFGGDEFTSYIIGGVGNEHMQINVGASQQEFNGRVPRWRP